MTLRAVDLFSGFGGFTAGASMAGAEVVWAANHWQTAVDVHSLNHPTTHHECQDLRQADWTSLPAFDLLMASPACQAHSQASQPNRRPYHDAMRATAWAVVDCAEVTRPKALIVENVLQFRRWQLYPLWKQALETLGYTLTEQLIMATAHGVPQRRERLFVIGTRNGARVSVPLSLRGEPAFESCLEPDASNWRDTAAAGPDSRDRIRRAQKLTGSRCLVQHVTGHPGVPLHEAIRTITTKVQWVLADGKRHRYLTPRELARGMGFPDSFTWPKLSTSDIVKGLGNAVCPPVARDVVAAVGRAIA